MGRLTGGCLSFAFRSENTREGQADAILQIQRPHYHSSSEGTTGLIQLVAMVDKNLRGLRPGAFARDFRV